MNLTFTAYGFKVFTATRRFKGFFDAEKVNGKDDAVKVNCGKSCFFGLKPKGIVFEFDFNSVRFKGFHRDKKMISGS